MLNGEIEFKPNSFTPAGRDSAEQTINYRLREGRTTVVYEVNNRGAIPYKTKSMNPAPVEICIYTNLLRRCRPVSSCPLHLRGGVTDSHPIGHSKKMQKTNFAIFFFIPLPEGGIEPPTY